MSNFRSDRLSKQGLYSHTRSRNQQQNWTSINESLPIFTLPNEIFCTIFIFARNLSLVKYSGNLRHIGNPTEINISHVCRLWRSIVLNLPTLWDTYHYSMPRTKLVNPKIRFEVYLERSRLQLLDIWLNFRGDPRRISYSAHNEMFLRLIAHLDRWRRVTILLDDSFPLLRYCAELKTVDPVHLEHFALCGQTTRCGDVQRGTFTFPQLFIGGAKKLRSVRMESTSYAPCLPPLTNITTVRLEKPYALSYGLVEMTRVTLKAFVALITIPTLENLSIAGLGVFEPLEEMEFEELERVVIRNLKDLRCGEPSITKLLTYIQVPQLQHLTLRDVKFPDISAKSVLELTNLVLINCQVDWPSFAERWYLISSRVTHLTVSENSEGTFHHHALTSFVAEDDWPSLVSLSCNIQTISHLEMYLQLTLLRDPLNFRLRVHRNLLDMWYQRTPALIPHIDGVCVIKTWDSEGDPLIPLHWPYAEDRADHPYDKADYDPFRIISYH